MNCDGIDLEQRSIILLLLFKKKSKNLCLILLQFLLMIFMRIYVYAHQHTHIHTSTHSWLLSIISDERNHQVHVVLLNIIVLMTFFLLLLLFRFLSASYVNFSDFSSCLSGDSCHMQSKEKKERETKYIENYTFDHFNNLLN